MSDSLHDASYVRVLDVRGQPWPARTPVLPVAKCWCRRSRSSARYRDITRAFRAALTANGIFSFGHTALPNASDALEVPARFAAAPVDAFRRGQHLVGEIDAQALDLGLLIQRGLFLLHLAEKRVPDDQRALPGLCELFPLKRHS